MSNELKLPCEVGQVSDGYHTFEELYHHRHALFLALMRFKGGAWISKYHDDGSEMPGWFIAGLDTNDGPVTYHLPDNLWDIAKVAGAKILDVAPKWDGHTSHDVIYRITNSAWR